MGIFFFALQKDSPFCLSYMFYSRILSKPLPLVTPVLKWPLLYPAGGLLSIPHPVLSPGRLTWVSCSIPLGLSCPSTSLPSFPLSLPLCGLHPPPRQTFLLVGGNLTLTGIGLPAGTFPLMAATRCTTCPMEHLPWPLLGQRMGC